DLRGVRERGVQLDRRHVGHPHQRGQVVAEAVVDGAAVAVAGYGRRGHPLRPVRGAALLVEVLLVDAVGVALERQRPLLQMRQQSTGDPRVVVDDPALGEPCLRIEDLVEVGELETLPFDLDLGVGHFFFLGAGFSSFSSLASFTAARLASRAAMRSTTWAGSSVWGCSTISWPSAFFSMRSRTRSRYSSR